jgi:hypothetical protein
MEQLKHSGLGIGSFATSIVSAILIFLLLIAAGVMDVSTPGGLDENSVQAVVVGLCLLGFMGLALLALGLGIGGLFQKDRNKLFAVLGIIFSALTLLGTVGLVVLGTMFG